MLNFRPSRVPQQKPYRRVRGNFVTTDNGQDNQQSQPITVRIGGRETFTVSQLASQSNRHGLITGATGTGKTVTLQVLAEGFARAGVPVFAADVKGDLSGIAAQGSPHKEVDRRVGILNLQSYSQRAYPTVLWDVFGKQGHPVRTTVSEMGPLILSSLLELNDTQTGVVYACFAIADDEGMLLMDLKDLRAMLAWMGEHAKALRAEYGNLAPASLGAIQRRLLVLEEQGAEHFFGEPALEIRDLMQRDFSGNGVVSLLHSETLLRESPKLYAAFLLWLLSELFEELPEAGDLEKPKLVLFFDEAHLLFDRMPSSLVDKIEQVVRLIRSKAVGVYFVTQNASDLPESVLGQLGLKVAHGVRAFTPKDRKALRAAADSFRNDDGLDVAEALMLLGTGEALVSVLDVDGAPVSVKDTLIAPPESRIGPLSEAERAEVLERSPMRGRYETAIDRESAYEVLAQRAERAAKRAERAVKTEAELAAREEAQSHDAQSQPKPKARRSRRQGVGEAFLKSAVRSIGRSIGTKLVRGLLGSLLK
jgi:DNA helicase HerA-like ATPase